MSKAAKRTRLRRLRGHMTSLVEDLREVNLDNPDRDELFDLADEVELAAQNIRRMARTIGEELDDLISLN